MIVSIPTFSRVASITEAQSWEDILPSALFVLYAKGPGMYIINTPLWNPNRLYLGWVGLSNLVSEVFAGEGP